jgi:hypothetical protein
MSVVYDRDDGAERMRLLVVEDVTRDDVALDLTPHGLRGRYLPAFDRAAVKIQSTVRL